MPSASSHPTLQKMSQVPFASLLEAATRVPVNARLLLLVVAIHSGPRQRIDGVTIDLGVSNDTIVNEARTVASVGPAAQWLDVSPHLTDWVFPWSAIGTRIRCCWPCAWRFVQLQE